MLDTLGFVGKDATPLHFAILGFDENTLSAVNDFKRAAKLLNEGKDIEGVVGNTTWDLLVELSKFQYNGEALKQGASNDALQVKVLQLRLRQLNFYAGDLTGTFDDATTMAVNSFKDFLRLGNKGEYKGVVGGQTWDMLMNTSQMGSYEEPNERGFIAPLAYMYVTAGYGDTLHHKRWHRGTDLRGAAGTPIFAIASGEIKYIEEVPPTEDEGRGNWIVLEHSDTKDRSFYQHNDRNLVVVGQQVVQGQVVATVGDTGASDGDHLHIELLINRDGGLEGEDWNFEDYNTPKFHEDPVDVIPGVYSVPIR
jgi:murein DD-endopeptidase MepM/ murein hydrolase activator NlpD